MLSACVLVSCSESCWRRIALSGFMPRVEGFGLQSLGIGVTPHGTIEVLMGEVSDEKHPVDGHLMNLRKDVRKPETMLDYSTFKGIEPERAPYSVREGGSWGPLTRRSPKA